MPKRTAPPLTIAEHRRAPEKEPRGARGSRSVGDGQSECRRGSRKGMDRFVSTFTNKIDAKGRVSVPASFRAVLERDGYTQGTPAASTATPRSMLRRSMQAARALRARSTGFSTACRIIRTSATSCLSRSMVTYTSSPSIRTDASCFLKALRAHAGLSTHVAFVGLGTQIPDVGARPLRGAARARPRESPPASPAFRRGAPPRSGGGAAREEHGNNGDARHPAGRGCPERDRAPCSRAASPDAAGARRRRTASASLTARSAPAATAKPS